MNVDSLPALKPAAVRQSEAREKALGLRDLRCFLSVAAAGNLGRAAQALNVSQPAVSLQLRKLEDGLGTQLLVRHGRGVTLTPAGARLRDRLSTVMRLLADPLEEADDVALPGMISFAVPAETSALLMAPLVRGFRTRWPEVMLDVREGSGAELEEWLLHRHVDLAVLQDLPALAEIEATPILTEDLGLVAPAHATIGQGNQPLPVRALTDQALILPDRRHWLRRRLDQAARQHGVGLASVLQVNSFALAKIMVHDGLGFAVLPRSAVRDEVARGRLAFRPIGQPALTCTHAIAFHRSASNTPVAAFASMAHDLMAALIEAGEPSEPSGTTSMTAATEAKPLQWRRGGASQSAWRATEEVAIG